MQGLEKEDFTNEEAHKLLEQVEARVQAMNEGQDRMDELQRQV